MLCPRWDANCIRSPADTGLPQKHEESGPIRPTYDPVRSPKVYFVHTCFLHSGDTPGSPCVTSPEPGRNMTSGTNPSFMYIADFTFPLGAISLAVHRVCDSQGHDRPCPVEEPPDNETERLSPFGDIMDCKEAP
jgi:hypothetical protein